MNKPTLLAIAPVTSQSGYGKHAVDLVRSLIKSDKYDVRIYPIRWGDTPLNALEKGRDDDILSRIIKDPNIKEKPNITVQITVPNEFNPIGEFNVGITAGIETTICSHEWIEGNNRMDLIIVPSEHAKTVFKNTKFVKQHPQTKQPMGEAVCHKPIEVLFEGADVNVYKRIDKLETDILKELSEIKEDWNYLFVGHWLQGQLGHDRKDVGMLIKVFLETFKDKDDAPGLILKTSSATFSHIDRNQITRKINSIKSSIPHEKHLPNIYLLHGQLTDEEMNELYNHEKVKCMVSFTKGEGFGRPLLEFSMSGKPIIASAWSGHIDFLDKEFAILLPGKLEKVHESAANNFLLKEAEWFTADYNVASKALIEVKENYHKFLTKSKKLMYQNKNNFSFDKMQQKLVQIIEKYQPEFKVKVDLKMPIDNILPSMNKNQGGSLPKQNKLPKLK